MDADRVGDWLLERGLLGSAVSVTPLDGGVSCEVFSATDGERSVVVKHAGPTLRVAAVWHADPRRVVHEGEVLRALSGLTPGSVPALLDIDRHNHMIAMSHAPPAWVPWKRWLLAGHGDPAVAATLGEVLATWHRSTWEDARYAALDDYGLFEDLRLEPYFAATQDAHPRYAEPLTAVTARLRRRRLCLVHGDFSPKNVMVGEEGTWVLDFEVGHIGDPEFDLAFMLTHLLLKAIHRPDDVSTYRSCASAFLEAYCDHGPNAGPMDGPGLRRLLGALVLARVHGKSPVEYLDDHGRRRAVELADALLFDELERLDSTWDVVERGS